MAERWTEEKWAQAEDFWYSGKTTRRRFLGFVPIRRGDHVLEVGCGTGVVLRDLAAMVGRRGSVVGVDPSLAITIVIAAAFFAVWRLVLARRGRRGATLGEFAEIDDAYAKATRLTER